jgi:hypothetical protein
MTTNNNLSNGNTVTINTPLYSNNVTAQNTVFSNINLGPSNTVFNAPVIIESDLEVKGNIKYKNKNLFELLEGIEKRLSILIPDPEKLEHFEALQRTYEQYKVLESLCQTPTKKEK